MMKGGAETGTRLRLVCMQLLRPAVPPTFGLVVDPVVDLTRCILRVVEVQAPELTLEVGFVSGHKGLLHGEALLAENAIGNEHSILIGPSHQRLVQLLQHLVRT